MGWLPERRRAIARAGRYSRWAGEGKGWMSAESRKDRLAAALRENLKRRKARSRAVAERPAEPPDPTEPLDSAKGTDPFPGDATQTPDGRRN
jgi:hypothetical protein